jgi:hypothetical protein
MSGMLFFSSCWVASAFLDIGVVQGSFTASSSNYTFSQDMVTGNVFEAANIVAKWKTVLDHLFIPASIRRWFVGMNLI